MLSSDESSLSHSPAPRQQQQHQQHALPAIFADAGWDRINNTILSTSNCGNPSLRHFGFGPTSGEGFGIGYIIKDGSVSICAASKHRQTKRFVDGIESYFLEIRKLIRMVQRRGTGGEKGSSRAREAEGMNRRGRVIEAQEGAKAEEESQGASDDELGGYGFFDAGMLLQALKAKEAHDERQNEKVVQRREVGKKLRLMEY
nr:hypothetical protein B0A51_06521 [Rachicladosporium sp. CCFEE 5018]